nr:hypothetical protein [Herbidospora cretacea]
MAITKRMAWSSVKARYKQSSRCGPSPLFDGLAFTWIDLPPAEQGEPGQFDAFGNDDLNIPEQGGELDLLCSWGHDRFAQVEREAPRSTRAGR